jgi:predicted RNA binding protein YcfA (HicA-like mRNA interferase family)
MKADQLLRVLQRDPLDYVVVRSKGSHRHLRSDNYPPLTFAFHSGQTIPAGLVKKILTKDVGLTDEQAWELL